MWDYQYITNSTQYRKNLQKALKASARKKKSYPFKYSIGDKVRIAYFRCTPFTRSYDELFSGEVFTVRTRKITDRVPVYYLTDYGGEKVEGNFYASELTPVRFDPNSFFKIEKVLKTRVRNGVEEKLVKYQSWPSKYNEWVISGRIRDIRNKKKKNTKKKQKK